MANLFSVDGLLFKISFWISRVMILTFLWLLFNLPFVTIGPSTLALFVVSSKLLKSEDTALFKSFLNAFKQNFKIGLVLTILIYLLGTNIVIVSRTVLLNLYVNWFLVLIGVIFLIECIGLLLFIISIMARYEMHVFAIIKSAFLMCNLHLISTLTGCAIILILVFIYFNSPLLFMMIGPASFSYIWCFMVRDILSRYEKPLATCT